MGFIPKKNKRLIVNGKMMENDHKPYQIFRYVIRQSHPKNLRSPTFNGLVQGKMLTGKPHDLHGTIYGFRFRFSQQNQSIETKKHMSTGSTAKVRLHGPRDLHRLRVPQAKPRNAGIILIVVNSG